MLIDAQRPRRRVVRLAIALALGGALVAPVAVSATQPARQINPLTAEGCCVCRGIGSDKSAIRSCTDATTPHSCDSLCRSASGSSIVFGYQQACNSERGCAGFATQGK